MKSKYSAAVIAAGCLWGFMGLFRRNMDALGFSANGVVLMRCGMAALLFALTLLAFDRKAFRIRLRDAWCFVGTGVVSLLLFTLCYFRAMQEMSLSAAAILLYTAPCFVILMSVPLFGEKLGGRKLAAMALAFAGCCLVSGLGGGGKGLTARGVLLGLGSGVCYALYSIFSRFALNRGYQSLTINFYSCLLAALGAAVLGGLKNVAGVPLAPSVVLWSLGTGAVTCYLPYMLYTYGLTGLENGRASIMASIEPVVATVVGMIFYGEALTLASAGGIVLVLAAIVLLGAGEKVR